MNNDNVFSLRDFYYILFKHKFSIFILVITAIFVALIGIYIHPDLYEAKANILVKMGRENFPSSSFSLSSSQQVVVSAGIKREEINSEIQILKSRYIIEKVVNKFGLDFLFPKEKKPRSFFKKLKYELKQFVKKFKKILDEILYKMALKNKITNYERALIAIEKNLSTKQITNSNVIEVKFKWFNPEIAREILKSVLDFYLEHHLESHKIKGSKGFFRKQVEIIGKKLKQYENKLQELKDDAKIYSFNEQKSSLLRQRNKLFSLFKDTERKIDSSHSKISELKKLMNSLKQSISPGFITSYKEAERELILEEAKLKSLEAERDTIKKQIREYNNKLDTLNSYSLELKRLQRQISIYEDNYRLYRKKLEEARISEVLDAERVVNVKIIDPASVSNLPVKPRKLLILGLSGLLSLIFGIAFAFISEYLDHSVKFSEDVKKYLKLPVLASIKEVKDLNKLDGIEKLSNNILLKSTKDKSKVLLFTSAIKREGVSTIASQLAITMAKYNKKKILLIDTNLRKPSIDRIFKINNNVGLSDLLRGNGKFEEVIRTTYIDNLYVITSGRNMKSPSTLLELNKLKNVILFAVKDFDYIILDSPPVNTFPDANILSPISDGIIMVIHAGKTRREVVINAKEQLEFAGANFIGTVLNRQRYVIPSFLYNRI